ncbi:MAG: Ig-like domain-containing protein, partial [Bifidobacteriaceae bacterium]|nr:Ig-like domain-containing protein [Bifidobacteriaceae bacterium]
MRRPSWSKPFAMLVCAAVALTGVTVLQSLGSGMGAWADGPPVDAEASWVVFDPEPQPDAPQPLGQQGGYYFTAQAMGPQNQPAAEAPLALRLERADGVQLMEGDAYIELVDGVSPGLEAACLADPQGQCAGWVRAARAGQYNLVVTSGEQPGQAFAAPPLYFEAAYPDPAASAVSITPLDKQAANRGDPDLEEADWGRQVVIVQLAQAGGSPLAGAAEQLKALAGGEDPFGGEGLDFSKAAESADTPGQYSINVYSSKAGVRLVEVAYADPQTGAEALLPSGQSGGQYTYSLAAPFTYPPASSADSYLSVTMADEEGGRLRPTVGESFQGQVVVWDAGRNNLIPGQTVALRTHDSCLLNAGLPGANLDSDENGEINFTVLGVDVGPCYVTAAIDGGQIAGSPSGAMTWQLPAEIGPASAENSYAEVDLYWQNSNNEANHDTPGVEPEDWGRARIVVSLRDQFDRPITNGAPALLATVHQTDPYAGARLYFGNGGVFECAEALEEGECAGGVYGLEVYAGTAGHRRVAVTYGAGTANAFELQHIDYRPLTGLDIQFWALDYEVESTTVVVSPSVPADDPDDPSDEPDGVPLALATGQSYEVVGTFWDKGRVNRVGPGTDMYLILEGVGEEEECLAFFTQGRHDEQDQRREGFEDGRAYFTITSLEPTTCVLRSDLSSDLSYAGLPKTLIWTDPELDRDNPATYYTVSSAPVGANGADRGLIEVQLYGLNGAPLTAAAASLRAQGEPGSGLEVSAFTHQGEGRYTASFSGTVEGDHTVTAQLAGQEIALLKPGGNATAHLALRISILPPSAAEVSQTEEQPANHDAPGSLRPEWGVQTITARLRDAAGEPITDAAAALIAAAAAGDPLAGVGLYFSNRGRFACAARVDAGGACAEGVYELAVFSSKAGTRQLTVTYQSGSDGAVVLPDADGLPVLRAPFAYPPPSAADSTLMVSPSAPADNPDDPADAPDGEPVIMPYSGGSYEVAVTVWDAGRNNRIPGVEVYLAAESNESEHGVYCDDVGFSVSGTYSPEATLTMDRNGRATARFLRADPVETVCDIYAYARIDGILPELAGSPKTVGWLLSDSETYDYQQFYYAVYGSNYRWALQANGLDQGVVEATLWAEDLSAKDSGGIWLTGAEDRLEASAPAGSGLAFGPWVYQGAGTYRAYFTGTEVGDFPVTVTLDGRVLSAFYSGDNIAHMEEPSSGTPAAAASGAYAIWDGVEASSPPRFTHVYNRGLAWVVVDLKTADGQLIQGKTAGLSWAAAPDDQYGGEGLFDLAGFMPTPGGGRTAEVDIGSTKTGVRRIIISYRDSETEFEVANGKDPETTVLELTFSAPQLKPTASTVVVYPTEPQADPDDPLDQTTGVPTPLPVGESYELVLTGWVKDRTQRGAGTVWLNLRTSEDNPACGFVEAGEDPKGEDWQQSGPDVYDTVSIEEDGRFSLSVYGYEAGVCVLEAVAIDRDRPSAWSGGQLAGSPATLRFVAAEADLENPGSGFDVSAEPVPADGNTTGGIFIELVDSDGQRLDDQLNAIEVKAPQGSGLEFSPVEAIGQGSGAYVVFFSGAQAGDFPIAVKVSGLPLGVLPQGNGIAHLTAAATRVGDEARSSATISVDAGQAGVYGQVGAKEGDYGKQTIKATVLDADAAPITSAAGKLSVQADAAYDPGGDLAFSGGGFVCAADLVEGECVDGVYRIDVYSGRPAARYLNVVYRDGATTFLLTNQAAPWGGLKQFTALFTTAPASAAASTLEVDPASPIEVGESYTGTVTVRDAFGNPVRDQEVEFELDGDSGACRGGIDGPSQVLSSELGEAQVTVTSKRGETCYLWAAVGGDYLEAGAELVWDWPPGPEADPSRTTVIVTPSQPEGSPQGLPQAIGLDDSYQIVVSVYAADGQTPVPGAPVVIDTGTADARWACTSAVREVGSTGPEETVYLETQADANGQVVALVRYPFGASGPGALCSLRVWVDGQRFHRLGLDDEGSAIPTYLWWRSAPDLAQDWTAYQVSAEPVAPYGIESGTIGVRLWSQTGPGLVDLSKLTVLVPEDSGLEVGEFAEAEDPDRPAIDLGAGTGYYSASFTGAVPGEWPIELFYEGKPVSLEEGGNNLARIAGPAVDPSRTTVVITPSTPANDPAGVPDVLPMALDQVYQVEVSAYDAEGKPAPGAEVYLGGGDLGLTWLCAVTITAEEGQANPSRNLYGWTGVDGKLRATVQNQSGYVSPGTTRVCDLRATVAGEEVLRYGAPQDPQDPPQATLLAWLSPPDLTGGHSNYNVSTDQVQADGDDEGTIDLQLWASGGYGPGPALADLSLLSVVVPPDSGLTVGKFAALPWQDDEYQRAYGASLPSGRYQAAFSGVLPGEFPIKVYYDGVLLGTADGSGGEGNGVATLVGGAEPPPVGPSPELSYAEVSLTADQAANHDAASAQPANWGRQTITATLLDYDGQPVGDAAGALKARPAAGDPVGGVGLYFGADGVFACAEDLVEGLCAGGVYRLEVYSSKAGQRQVEVVYGAGTGGGFALASSAGGSVLATQFAVPPLDPLASTVVISPSTPGDDPDDRADEPDSAPDTLDWGEEYTVVVTAWDEGRNNRVPATR